MEKGNEADGFNERLFKHLTDVLMARAPVYPDAVPNVARTCVSLMIEEFGGEQVYVKKQDPLIASRDETIRQEFDGRNFRELAHKHRLTERRVRDIVAAHTGSKKPDRGASR